MKTIAEEPIFPKTIQNGDDQYAWSTTNGLTKREYFAAMAMQGIISKRDNDSGVYTKEIVERSVQCADALIEELNK